MISIHIEAHPDRGNLKDQVDQSLAAIGFSRQLATAAADSREADLAKLQEIADRPAPTLGVNSEAVPAVSDVSDAKPAVEEKPKRATRAKKEEPAPIAPTPEPEAAAQDAADEAEESAVEAPKAEDGEVFTHDSVRKELGAYSTAYGLDFTRVDGPKIMGAEKVSAVPDTQEALGAATRALREAIVANPYGRAPAKAGA